MDFVFFFLIFFLKDSKVFFIPNLAETVILSDLSSQQNAKRRGIRSFMAAAVSNNIYFPNKLNHFWKKRFANRDSVVRPAFNHRLTGIAC